MGITITLRGGSGDMKMADYDSDKDGVFAMAQLDSQLDSILFTEIEKSDTLKHSYDALSTGSGGASTYEKIKEITLDKATHLVGSIRIKYELGNYNGTTTGVIKINGVTVGAEKTSEGTAGSWTYRAVETEDFDVELKPDDTIEYWIKNTESGADGGVKNLRLYFSRIITNAKASFDFVNA